MFKIVLPRSGWRLRANDEAKRGSATVGISRIRVAGPRVGDTSRVKQYQLRVVDCSLPIHRATGRPAPKGRSELTWSCGVVDRASGLAHQPHPHTSNNKRDKSSKVATLGLEPKASLRCVEGFMRPDISRASREIPLSCLYGSAHSPEKESSHVRITHRDRRRMAAEPTRPGGGQQGRRPRRHLRMGCLYCRPPSAARTRERKSPVSRSPAHGLPRKCRLLGARWPRSHRCPRQWPAGVAQQMSWPVIPGAPAL